jgi:hypothetical protein
MLQEVIVQVELVLAIFVRKAMRKSDRCVVDTVHLVLSSILASSNAGPNGSNI